MSANVQQSVRLALMAKARELATAAYEAGDDPAFRALARARYFLALNVANWIVTIPVDHIESLPAPIAQDALSLIRYARRVRLVPSQGACGGVWVVLPDLAHWCECPAPGICWHSAVSEVLDAYEADQAWLEALPDDNASDVRYTSPAAMFDTNAILCSCTG